MAIPSPAGGIDSAPRAGVDSNPPPHAGGLTGPPAPSRRLRRRCPSQAGGIDRAPALSRRRRRRCPSPSRWHRQGPPPRGAGVDGDSPPSGPGVDSDLPHSVALTSTAIPLPVFTDRAPCPVALASTGPPSRRRLVKGHLTAMAPASMAIPLPLRWRQWQSLPRASGNERAPSPWQWANGKTPQCQWRR